MKAMCIDASPGFQSKEKPPFKEGKIYEVIQSPYHPEDYVVVRFKGMGWHKKRFMPVSEIDERRYAVERSVATEVAQ